MDLFGKVTLGLSNIIVAKDIKKLMQLIKFCEYLLI